MRGNVKWFNDSKGYGFITACVASVDTDIFVHYTDILGEGFKTLQESKEVDFDLYEVEGPRTRYVAKNVKRE